MNNQQLHPHPQANWPFPKWLPYPYVPQKEPVKPLPEALF